jgi:predicted methyltransferase
MTSTRRTRNRRRAHRAAIALTTVAAIVARSPIAQAQGDDIFARRDQWQRTADMIDALGDVRGRRIADIAAGTGYLTKALSKQVGSKGRVYAVEIGEKELAVLRGIAQQDSFANVVVVAGTETDTRLPDALDGAIILNSYHEIAQIRAILATVLHALRPGGSLVLVDNNPFDGWKAEAREFQTSHHAIDPAIVEREVRAAGFEIARRDDAFIATPVSQWLVVARRPPR